MKTIGNQLSTAYYAGIGITGVGLSVVIAIFLILEVV